MRSLILIALTGAAAQLVDGGIGMGFGVTSTTILLLAGLGPAHAVEGQPCSRCQFAAGRCPVFAQIV